MGTKKLNASFKRCVSLLNSNEVEDAISLIRSEPSIGQMLLRDECLFRRALYLGYSLRELAKLQRAGLNVDLRDSLGCTPLMVVASKGSNIRLAKLLVESGAFVNAQSLEGESALSFACSRNHLRMVKWLLANGADCNLKVGSPPSSTPLDWAILYGSTDMQALLREHGALPMSCK